MSILKISGRYFGPGGCGLSHAARGLESHRNEGIVKSGRQDRGWRRFRRGGKLEGFGEERPNLMISFMTDRVKKGGNPVRRFDS